MAYVNVPKDLSKVKTKLALGLTKRQLICFGIAAAIGIPTYIFLRGGLGNTFAALLMIAIMLPFFFLAMYEKDGQTAEVILCNIIRARYLFPQVRIYQTENRFEKILKGDEAVGTTPKTNKTSDKKAVRKTNKKH
jgi:hypothetical protein